MSAVRWLLIDRVLYGFMAVMPLEKISIKVMSRWFKRGAIKVPFDRPRVPERAFFVRLQIPDIFI